MSINQFMWGFQPYFRHGLERVASEVFERIGFGLGARAFLVGFTDKATQPFPVCFEPENDPLAAVDLSSVITDARQRYEASDEARISYGSTRHHQRIHRGYKDSFRADALRDALARSEEGASLTFFVGSSALVDAIYEVHPVVAVPTARWVSKPALSRSRVDRYPVDCSFQHALMRELLSAATADLGSSTPPEQFSIEWSDRSELVRKAARAFVQSVSVLSGYQYQSELAIALDEISAQPYEGRSGAGAVLLASTANPHVDRVLDFTEPIRMSQTRSIRKALEMAGSEHHLLCNGKQVVGLARLAADYQPANENAFVFTVMSRGVWELSHDEVPLLRMSNTRPSLPQPRLDRQKFISIARRVFPEISHTDAEVQWGLVESAAEAAHGTTLVVHRHAEIEAARLTPQAQQVHPKRLDGKLLAAVTNIDGAVLVDTSGTCHAVGVILDGRASGHGDPSRGARYNSAVRYHEAQTGQCLVVIVSEDGMLDLLPNLRRQVTRASVEAVVRQLEMSMVDDPDYEVFFRHWEHLESLTFYLTEQQCARVNEARTRLEEHRAQPDPDDPDPIHGMVGRITHVGWTPFAPDPEMNSSYYLGDDDG